MTWASKSLDVTESITGDLPNQTLNYAEHKRLFPEERDFIESLKTLQQSELTTTAFGAPAEVYGPALAYQITRRLGPSFKVETTACG